MAKKNESNRCNKFCKAGVLHEKLGEKQVMNVEYELEIKKNSMTFLYQNPGG